MRFYKFASIVIFVFSQNTLAGDLSQFIVAKNSGPRIVGNEVVQSGKLVVIMGEVMPSTKTHFRIRASKHDYQIRRDQISYSEAEKLLVPGDKASVVAPISGVEVNAK